MQNTTPTNANTNLMPLFKKADSLSINDEFVRFFDPTIDDGAISMEVDDIKFSFSEQSIATAKNNENDTYELFCSESDQFVTISFYSVSLLK